MKEKNVGELIEPSEEELRELHECYMNIIEFYELKARKVFCQYLDLRCKREKAEKNDQKN